MELVVVFVLALSFYSVTLAPTILWGDSAWLTLFARLGATGFRTAGDHPLYLRVGQLFMALPGEPARNMALESAVFGALAVMLVFRIGRQLGVSRLSAAIGAGALCVSHAFWLHAVIPEVYTANTFFLLATLSLLVQWHLTGRTLFLAGAFAIFLLGLTNHLVLASALPAIAVFIAIARPKIFLTARAAGAAALIVLAAVTAALVPSPLSRALIKIWVGPPGISDYFHLQFPVLAMLRETGFYVAYLVYQFPSISLPVGLVGAVALSRSHRPIAVLLLLTLLVNAGVFIHHTDWPSSSSSKFVFYITDYAVFSIFCAAGAETVLRALQRPRAPDRSLAWGAALLGLTVAIPPVFYAAMPQVSNTYGLSLANGSELPYRDNSTYFLNPNKRGYDGARRFGEETLAGVPASAVIFADYTPFAVLRYLQLMEGLRPDVLLKFPGQEGRVRVAWVYEADRRRPTYVVSRSLGSYDLSGLSGHYDLLPAGLIVEVRPRD